jgi:Leucine-rich repeat (LRR) protein
MAGYAQSGKPDPKHEKNVRDMIKFLEYMLNTLGDEKTAAQDKEILVTQSYSKIFRDGKVQVEDDLVEKRNVITNKDVTAYLKDVDFFFTHVQFEFNIEEIVSGGSDDKLFYKVKIARNLKGKSIEGKAINNTIPRFVEINYNPKEQDLKIVSMYTNEFDEKEALTRWWNELSFEWQGIFRRQAHLVDSVDLDGIKKITGIDSLNLAKNRYLQNIEPLAQLPGLRYLNISSSQISDLTPIRNLTELVYLDISKTAVTDVAPLRYSTNLRHLAMHNTRVTEVSAVANLESLEYLSMASVRATDFSAMESLISLKQLDVSRTRVSDISWIKSSNLTNLNISGTAVTDVSPLAGLTHLQQLSIDSLYITQLNSLSGLKELKVLSLNHTPVNTLDALKKLPQLERIYCDNTGIKQDAANAFMATNPNALVIFDSGDLRGWWGSLSASWREVFRRGARIGTNPTKEELALVTNMDSVNLASDVSIHDLAPLARLQKIRVLVAAKTSIDDLSVIQNANGLQVLDVSQTQLSDPGSLTRFINLVELRAERTQIQQIDTLVALKKLTKLYVDHTAVTDDQVRRFLEKNPSCLVVYKTNVLEQWWGSLTDTWKQIFQRQLNMQTLSAREHLHRLVESEKVAFTGEPVDNLKPLEEFVRLRELHFSGSNVKSLEPLHKMRTLISLRVNDNPIREISAITNLDQLQDLDISNTAVEDLDLLHNFQQLTRLSCAGTRIKKLDLLERMKELKYLDCSNTDVRRLDPVSNLSLAELKCYNTRITDKEVDSFRKSNPSCKVTYYR